MFRSEKLDDDDDDNDDDGNNNNNNNNNKWYKLASFQTHMWVLTYLTKYSMEQSPSWEANRFSASQETLRI
jgi:hypothetical protein